MAAIISRSISCDRSAETAFATAHARGDFVLRTTRSKAALYEVTQENLAAGLAGLRNLQSRAAGRESRHNLVYWRYDDYLGIGPVRIAG